MLPRTLRREGMMQISLVVLMLLMAPALVAKEAGKNCK